jgi:hypothetical protein
VNGNLNVTSTATNAINLGSGTSNTNNVVNVKGNFNKSGSGTIGLSGTYSATAIYNFNGTGTKTFSYSGAAMTGGGITVASGRTLQLLSNLTSASSANANPINISGALDCQGFAVTASNATNTFSLSATGTLKTSSVTGVAGAVTGFTATPSFASGATFEFSGTGQNTGFTTFTGITTLNQYSITWTGSTSLTLDKTVALNTLNFTNSGLIYLGNFDITISSSGSITGGSFSATKMIVADQTGTLKKAYATPSAVTFVYPIGESTGTVEYSPVSLTMTSASSGTIGFKVTDATHPNNAPSAHSISRYWTVNNTFAASYSWTGSFTYVSADINGTETNMKLNVFDNTNFGWTQFASNSSAASNVLTVGAAVTSSLLTNGDVTARLDVPLYF